MTERQERIRYYSFAAFVGVLLLLNWVGVFTTVFGIDTAIFITLLAGYKTFQNSIAALLERRISADIALCIAVIAALSVGQYMAAAEAMFIVLVGEGLESYAAGRTAAAIGRFVEQMPRRARVLRDGREEEVDAAALVPGDLIAVRAGERVPADGFIEAGTSEVNESSITGEPLPREKTQGDEIFSGSLNGSGFLRIRVSRAGDDTTLARVARLVSDAQYRRAPVERLADRSARYFLPALLLAAGLTFYFTRDWMRTVAVLIVACPCALILATPTAMVAAIGGLARRGILVRGGSVLQLAANVGVVVFDKTGTITEGQFEIIRILTDGRPEHRLVAEVAAIESVSRHPLAQVVAAEAKRRSLEIPPIEGGLVVPGRGVEAAIGGRRVRVGNVDFIAEAGVQPSREWTDQCDAAGATSIWVAEDDAVAGVILLRDRVRPGVRECVAGLGDIGIDRLIMLTGDRPRAAEAIARKAGIREVEAGLLPEQKLERIRQLMGEGADVCMVGDGINDAPALATATVGVAVAGASDITAEAADVVFLPHSLETLPALFSTSRRAVATAWQNIILFAGILNFAVVLLAARGILSPIGAAFTHQLSSFLVMLNSLRLLQPEGFWRRRAEPLTDWCRAAADTIEPAAFFRQIWARRRELRRPLSMTAVTVLLLSGVYSIGPAEIGIVRRFGHVRQPHATPGMHYKLPWPIDRLTRIQPAQVRVVELGFRSQVVDPRSEPATYEWNAEHSSGRFVRKPEESLVLAGDQNMIELNAVVHYDLARPEAFVLNQADGAATVRATFESVVASIVTQSAMDELLTTGRAAVEGHIRKHLQDELDHYACGVRVLGVRLEDVHPSTEVVPAFRDVSGASEEKSRLINEAEAYHNEQVALARGNAAAAKAQAAGYAADRVDRAFGDASRFTQRESAFRKSPETTETRLYWETMEQVLPGKRKLIVDSTKARRHLITLEDGVEVGGAALNPILSGAAPNIAGPPK